MELRQKSVFYAIVLPMIVSGGYMCFTNLKCVAFDEPFATFEQCNLKVVDRGVVALNIHVNLYQVPVNNVSANVAVYKKANGYRPFLYNESVDFCRFYKNQRKYPFLKIFVDSILKHSNINHTCPYDHDIIIRNMVLNANMFRLLPLPSGEYMFKVYVGDYNDWKADIAVYFRRLE